MDWERYPIIKIENRKSCGQNAACEQKTSSEKQIFVQTPFSHSNFKLD